LVLETETKTPPLSSITIGNGECFASAQQIFGQEMAESFWQISRRNFDRAKQGLAQLNVTASPGNVYWFAANDREKVLLEKSIASGEMSLEEGAVKNQQGARSFALVAKSPCLQFSHELFASSAQDQLAADGISIQKISSLNSVGKKGALRYVLQYADASGTKEIESSLVLFFDDILIASLFPSCADKIIPVTLSSFLFAKKKDLPLRGAIFNNGADFAYNDPQGWCLGSYRNLFEDKAVGVKNQADPVTLKGVKSFFSSMDWIDPLAEPLEQRLSIESISCDGLPVVGALADLPGIYVGGGFSARSANFLFEVVAKLASGILGREGFSDLTLFSTKRFI
jgi:hypothetical protein